MPSLITILGSCLVAAGTMYSWSAAVAADRPGNPAGEPWWSNPLTAASESKVAEYPPAAAGAGRGAEFAPDPPGVPRHDTLPAVFQQDFTSPLETPAAGTPAGRPKALESALPAAVRPLPPPQLAATAPGANPVAAAPAAGTPPAADPSPLTAQQESATPLALSSGHQVLMVGGKNISGKASPLGATITVGGSLAIVLGLFFIVAWVVRKTAPRGSLVLPKEVFDVLGRAPLGARQQVQLLRCGNKLLLVSITPTGAETLTEVTDPLEVDRIAGICRQAHPKGAATAFRQVFQQVASDSGAPSELDDLQPAGTRRKKYRWEEDHA